MDGIFDNIEFINESTNNNNNNTNSHKNIQNNSNNNYSNGYDNKNKVNKEPVKKMTIIVNNNPYIKMALKKLKKIMIRIIMKMIINRNIIRK